MMRCVRYLAVCALLVGTGFFLQGHSIKPSPLPEPLALFPAAIGEWRKTADTTFTPSELEVLRPTDYLVRRYENPSGDVVELYIGYHDGAQDAGPLHSPKNCLPGGGWYREESEKIQLELGHNHVSMASAIYAQGARRELFIYWFMSAGEAFDDEYSFKLAGALHSMLNARQDSALVRVNVPLRTSGDQAMATAHTFLQQVFPIITDKLPQ